MPERPSGKRRLAAVMFTDMVGFSRRTEENETLTLDLLHEHRKVIRPVFAGYGGREIKTTGDGFHVEFPSVLDAVRAAVEMQKALYLRNVDMPEDRQVLIRIGVHLGDVTEHEGDIFGEGVNLAARIEPLAEPGGICVTRAVHDLVRNQLTERMFRLGAERLKNLAQPVEVWRLELPWESPPGRTGSPSISGGSDPSRPTVLAALLMGHTEFTKFLLEEEAAAARIMVAYHQLAKRCIEAAGGRQFKVSGALILAVFPGTLEAIRSAIDLHHEFAERVRPEPSAAGSPGLRIGIHEGPVHLVVDEVIGTTVNFAVRLSMQATSGSVWMSGDAYRATEDRMTWRVVNEGLVAFKGIGNPQEVYSIDSTTADRAQSATVDDLAVRHELLAVMFTDLRGFTKQMSRDESTTLLVLREYMDLLRMQFERHHGHELKLLADAFIVGFASAVDAVRCAVAIREAVGLEYGRAGRTLPCLGIGIGIHVGEVLRIAGEVLGPPVICSESLMDLARGEPLVDVVVSGQVRDLVADRLRVPFEPVDLAGRDWLPPGLTAFRLLAAPGKPPV